MRQPFLRLVLTFLIAAGGVLIAASCGQMSRSPEPPPPVDRSNSPHSVLTGNTIKIVPYNATFDMPADWLPSKFGKNLYLTNEELQSLYYKRTFQARKAEFLDSVLPYDRCAAHFGEKGWDEGVVSDQARVYIIRKPVDELTDELKNAGPQSERIFDNALISEGNLKSWQRITFNTTELGEHTILMQDIDFYLKAFGDDCVIFAFIHQVGDNALQSREEILSSFEWPAPE